MMPAMLSRSLSINIERSQGRYKWDGDDNQLIDFWRGHGVLVPGHSHPAMVTAVQPQMA